MSIVSQSSGGGRAGSLYDVIELILDKGLVIDAFVRVSLLGIEVLTVETRIVVASVDTYLRFAELAGGLDLAGARPGTPPSDAAAPSELVTAPADSDPERITNRQAKSAAGRKEDGR